MTARSGIEAGELQATREFLLVAISHELRTPVTVVAGLAQTLRNHTARLSEAQRVELIEGLHKNAQRLKDVVTDVLDYRQLGGDRAADIPQRVDLAPVVSHAAARNCALERLLLDVEPVEVAARTDLVARIVEELVENAAKYSAGDVTVTLRPHLAGALIQVADRGKGLQVDAPKELFEPFRHGPATESHAPGFGLGLAVVAGLVERAGGTITVIDTKPGTRFDVVIPPWRRSTHAALETRDTIASLLGVARRHLNMSIAYVGRFQQGQQFIEIVDGTSGPAIHEGDATPIQETYCVRVVSGQAPNVIPDTAAEPSVSSLPATQDMRLGSYVGVPILLNDARVYGMLCCASEQPDESLGSEDASFLAIIAALIADEIQRSDDRPVDEGGGDSS